MKTVIIHCPTCRAPVEVDPAAITHRCGHCEAMITVSATHASVGEWMGRFVGLLEKHDAEVSAAKAAVERAVARKDEAALEEAVAGYMAWDLHIREEAGYFAFLGLRSPEEIAQMKEAMVRQEMQQRLETLRGTGHAALVAEAMARAEAGAAEGPPPAESGPDTGAYVEAIMAQDPAALAAASRAMYRQIYASQKLSPKKRHELVEAAVEAQLRAQPWVTKEDLKHLGVKVLHDAKRTDEGIEVACQNCRAPITAPFGTESLTCPFCAAVTRVGLDRQTEDAVFDRAFEASRAAAKGESED